MRRLARWPGQTRDVDDLRAVLRGPPAHPGRPRWPARPAPASPPLFSPGRGDPGRPAAGPSHVPAAGFDRAQVHADLLSGEVHAVPTRTTDTAADADHPLEAAPRSGDGVPAEPVVGHDPRRACAPLKEPAGP